MSGLMTEVFKLYEIVLTKIEEKEDRHTKPTIYWIIYGQ